MRRLVARLLLQLVVAVVGLEGVRAGCCWLLQEQTLQGGAIGLYGSFIFRCNIDHYSPNMAVKLRLWKHNLDVSVIAHFVPVHNITFLRLETRKPPFLVWSAAAVPRRL